MLRRLSLHYLRHKSIKIDRERIIAGFNHRFFEMHRVALRKLCLKGFVIILTSFGAHDNTHQYVITPHLDKEFSGEK